MKFIQTKLEGLCVVESPIFEDVRGKFVKSFNSDMFNANGIDIDIKESYYSLSQKNVIRGMHFQTPPYDHVKIVYVPSGSICDVVLDIRKESPTYGEYFSIILSDENGKGLVIPKGFAHGFLSLQDNTNVTYMQTTGYAPNHDSGIKYNSFGYEWGVKNPIVSDRDTALESFTTFQTPFVDGYYL